MKTLGTFTLLLILSFETFGQKIESEFNCLNNTYKFELPGDFEAHKFKYTEGNYYYYFRVDTLLKVDTTVLVLHCGTNVQLPHLSDSTYVIEYSNELEKTGKQLYNNKYWRELNLPKGINLYYYNATLSEKKTLDSLINNLKNQVDKTRR